MLIKTEDIKLGEWGSNIRVACKRDKLRFSLEIIVFVALFIFGAGCCCSRGHLYCRWPNTTRRPISFCFTIHGRRYFALLIQCLPPASALDGVLGVSCMRLPSSVTSKHLSWFSTLFSLSLMVVIFCLHLCER